MDLDRILEAVNSEIFDCNHGVKLAEFLRSVCVDVKKVKGKLALKRLEFADCPQLGDRGVAALAESAAILGVDTVLFRYLDALTDEGAQKMADILSNQTTHTHTPIKVSLRGCIGVADMSAPSVRRLHGQMTTEWGEEARVELDDTAMDDKYVREMSHAGACV